MDNKLFIKGENGEFYEGPLSDKPTKLLFVMKEPNGDDLNCFWMKEKVITRKEGTKYYNVLGAFAKSFINVNTHKEALEQSAYINLYPFNGKATVSDGYKSVIKTTHWKNVKELDNASEITEQSTPKETLCNRLKIIKDALEAGLCVVAHYQIVERIINYSVIKNDFKKTSDYYDNEYHITSYSYKDKAKLLAVPHPTNRQLKCSELEKILNTTIYP